MWVTFDETEKGVHLLLDFCNHVEMEQLDWGYGLKFLGDLFIFSCNNSIHRLIFLDSIKIVDRNILVIFFEIDFH